MFLKSFQKFESSRYLFREGGPELGGGIEAEGEAPSRGDESQEGNLDDRAAAAGARVDARVDAVASGVGADAGEALAAEAPSRDEVALGEVEADADRQVSGVRDELAEGLQSEGIAVVETAEVGPTAVDAAEHVRLGEEMERLSKRNAWKGVEAAYQDMLGLNGVELTYDDHFLAAQAARALGNAGDVVDRLEAAQAIDVTDEVTEWLGDLERNYSGVRLGVDSKYKGDSTLKVAVMPFAPDQRAAIDTAMAQIAETGSYDGPLPAGEYTLGDQTFVVEAGKPLQTVNLLSDKFSEDFALMEQALYGNFDFMKKAGGRNNWQAVEAEFAKAEPLLKKFAERGVSFRYQDGLYDYAAQAARALGNLDDVYARLQHAGDSQRIKEWIADIDGHYAQAELSLPRRSEFKPVEGMPAAPDQRAAIEGAQAALAEKGKFKGLLPRGEYIAGDERIVVS